MTFDVRVSESAEQEIRQAYRYIAEHGPANPERWKAGLDEFLSSLGSLPERFGLAPESQFRSVTIHQALYANYRILYVIEEGVVHVVAFRHGARLPLTGDDLEERL